MGFPLARNLSHFAVANDFPLLRPPIEITYLESILSTKNRKYLFPIPRLFVVIRQFLSYFLYGCGYIDIASLLNFKFLCFVPASLGF